MADIWYSVISHKRPQTSLARTVALLERCAVPRERRVLGYSCGDYSECISYFGHAYEQPVGLFPARFASYGALRELAPHGYWLTMDDDLLDIRAIVDLLSVDPLRYRIEPLPAYGLERALRHAIDWLDRNIPDWISATFNTRVIPMRMGLYAQYPTWHVQAMMLWRPCPQRDALIEALRRDYESNEPFCDCDDTYMTLACLERGWVLPQLRWIGYISGMWAKDGGTADQRKSGSYRSTTRWLFRRFRRYLSVKPRSRREFDIRLSIPRVRVPVSLADLHALRDALFSEPVAL